MRTKYNIGTSIKVRCSCGKYIVICTDYGESFKHEKKSRFVPPTPEEVNVYAKNINFEIDSKGFCDYYNTIGWVVGKSRKPMCDWKAAVRYWKRTPSNKKGKVQKFTKEIKKHIGPLLDAYLIVSKKKDTSVNFNDVHSGSIIINRHRSA